eukprot:jgi/Ulvmu1/12487/UM009_0140.1
MDPGNAAAYQAWALLEKHDGNMQKAQQLLEYCLELNPKHEPSLHALAKLHLDRCHFVQARKLLQQVLRINPSHAHSWTTLGELCYYQGDPAQSRRIYEQMVAYCGEDSIAYATWAHMETRMGDNGKARRLLERSIELDPWNIQAHTQLLALLCNDPHLEHMAPAQFRATLHRFPKNVHIRHLSAAFLIAQGREDVAQAVLEELAKEQSENGKIAQTQARLHIRRGEREAAAQCLRRGMCDSSRENALVCTEELAKLALSEGRPDVAQELLQYGAARAAPTSRYLREWGLIERKLGNTTTARSLFQQSVESRAMDVRSWVAWAVLERSCDDFPKALEVLRQGLTVAPKVTTLWYLYCDTACKCLPLRKCREVFHEAHKCVPRCPQTYLLEATLEWKHGYEEQARRAFVQGSRYAAGSPEAYSPLFQAWAHFEEVCGNSDEAAGLVAKCAQVQETEQRRSRTTNAAGVDALVDLLRIPTISTAPVAHV